MSESEFAVSSFIGFLRASGGPRALGRALGEKGRHAVHEYLLPSAIWATITAPEQHESVARMAAATRTHFPEIWAELEGLAEGLALPLEEVFAWNCRGDLLAGEAPDGCTTLQLPGEAPLIAHNEDGLPFFHGHCFMVEAAPTERPRFTAFCYPGSLPGHTFAFTTAGLVQAVNNMRLTEVTPTIPRMVLGRATLAQPTLHDALALLCRHPGSGGFHFTLAEAGSGDMLSIEFGGGEVASRQLTSPWVHANHALYHAGGLARQRITDSSRDRQRRAEVLLEAGVIEPLAMLHDTDGEGLPILRLSADDPDHENTLATAVMQLSADGVAWRVYDRPGAEPVHAGYLAYQHAT